MSGVPRPSTSTAFSSARRSAPRSRSLLCCPWHPEDGRPASSCGRSPWWRQGCWWPDWDRGDTWRLGLLQGGASAAYFGANAFIPEFLRAMGRPQAIGGALAMLNAGQLPASLLALGLASSLVGRRFPFVVVSLGILGGLGVFLLGPSWAPAAGAGILGLCFAFVLILTLALPPVYAAPDDIHRLSAAMFAIGYLYSFVIPLLGGAAWDLARAPGAAFLPVVVGALTVLGAAAGLPPRGTGAGRGGGGREGGRSP